MLCSESGNADAGARNGAYSSGVERFLRPVSDCEFTITSLLDELQRDSFPVSSEQRPLRCIGAALKVAAGTLAACSPDTGARIIGLVGGPCTDGPGLIVSKELTDPIRSHKDFAKDSASYYSKAVEFYDGLAKQLVSQGHVLDVFACAVDQVGISLFDPSAIFIRVVTRCSGSPSTSCMLYLIIYWSVYKDILFQKSNFSWGAVLEFSVYT